MGKMNDDKSISIAKWDWGTECKFHRNDQWGDTYENLTPATCSRLGKLVDSYADRFQEYSHYIGQYSMRINAFTFKESNGS